MIEKDTRTKWTGYGEGEGMMGREGGKESDRVKTSCLSGEKVSGEGHS